MQVDEPLLGARNYADAFEVRVEGPDQRSVEQWLRAGLEQAPPALRRVIAVAHRRVLRLRLGPSTAADHVFGWAITGAAPGVVRLTASGPLIRAVIVGRKTEPTRLVLTSAVGFERPAGRLVWALLAPVHRRIARYLLAYAADEPARDRATPTAG